MQTILQRIYGKQKAAAAAARIAAVLDAFSPQQPLAQAGPLTEADAILVTYADTLTREGERPLRTLNRFAHKHFKDVFSGIHILPFFPYSSDDGFSVTDFFSVRPDLGSWEDIRAIGEDFKLMVDLVANHVSAQSRWFQNYLAGEKGFEHLAIEVDPAADFSGVIRPRSLPLLTAFEKHSGQRVHLWTTFSADQIDLNYGSLDVLENMVQALLFYVSQGARIIRLDAIAYLWKQIGTPCIHLPQAHDLVRLFRRILDRVAPGVVLITETNVPHEENIRYFGNGHDEAQMVYNFTLPPLLLYSLAKGGARVLSEWAQTLATPSADTAFFNFTASHDGIGVRPLEGILTATEILWLADIVRRNGGKVSMKANPDGSQSPYELNITYVDALRNPARARRSVSCRALSGFSGGGARPARCSGRLYSQSLGIVQLDRRGSANRTGANDQPGETHNRRAGHAAGRSARSSDADFLPLSRPGAPSNTAARLPSGGRGAGSLPRRPGFCREALLPGADPYRRDQFFRRYPDGCPAEDERQWRRRGSHQPQSVSCRCGSAFSLRNPLAGPLRAAVVHLKTISVRPEMVDL